MSKNFHWYHTLLVTIAALIVFAVTRIALFDYIFVLGIIFTIIHFIKERKAKKTIPKEIK